ncbi:NAD-dependent protein deacetylase sir-2.1 [Aphelenchoides bicaudatus]|nr:NAD-dependent protein deacetylase sir-2.1 [Aphelenchoides bicaudatus]
MDNETEVVKVQQKEEIIRAEKNGVESSSKIEYSAKIVTLTDEDMSSGTETRSPAEDLSLNEREDRLEQKWKKPSQSNFGLVQEMLERGLSPSQILQSLIGNECKLPVGMSESTALRLLIQFVSERRFRHRLPQYNDFTHAVELFKQSKNILIISGAGISVNCGIPDFRSSTGIYASLKQTFPDLPSPTSMFDIDYFKRNPRPFYSFAKQIFPGQYKPSLSHFFIKFLEEEKKLLRNYTQNIDTLEQVCGIKRHVDCHGSFATATCLQCSHEFTSDDIKEEIYAQKVAICSHCGDGLIKPDIVFFGENLPDKFHLQMAEDRDLVDLVVVIGSSLQVQPVSLIPYNVDEKVPQILINKEDLSSFNADIKLIGDCDAITTALCIASGGNLRNLMIEELKSRSTPLLAELETLLAKHSDSLFPEIVTETEIKEQLEKECEDKQVEEEDVPTKKIKLSEENGHSTQESETKLDPVEELRQMYEAKYISISSKLKSYSYAKFSPNLSIFNGADFYYDTDQKSFGPLPRRRSDSPNDPYDSDDQSSTAETTSSFNTSRSNPETRRKDCDYEQVERETESCPPFLESVPNSPSSSF